MTHCVKKRHLASSPLDAHWHDFAPTAPVLSALRCLQERRGAEKPAGDSLLGPRAFWPLSVHILFSSKSPSC